MCRSPATQGENHVTASLRLLEHLSPSLPLTPNAVRVENMGIFLQPFPHLPRSQVLPEIGQLIWRENFNCLKNEGAEN